MGISHPSGNCKLVKQSTPAKNESFVTDTNYDWSLEGTAGDKAEDRRVYMYRFAGRDIDDVRAIMLRQVEN